MTLPMYLGNYESVCHSDAYMYVDDRDVPGGR
jgi:hypothetical protein